jgi:hypothetical protein
VGSIRRHIVSICALATLGCREPTEVVLEISTDVPCTPSITTEIRAGRLLQDVETKPPATSTTACDPSGRVGSIVAIPSDDDKASVAFKVVTAFGPGSSADACAADARGHGCIVARRALGFIPHTKLVVPVAMRTQCAGVTCPAVETCVRGTCRPATRPKERLGKPCTFGTLWPLRPACDGRPMRQRAATRNESRIRHCAPTLGAT